MNYSRRIAHTMYVILPGPLLTTSFVASHHVLGRDDASASSIIRTYTTTRKHHYINLLSATAVPDHVNFVAGQAHVARGT
jgi:hypothetical protein